MAQNDIFDYLKGSCCKGDKSSPGIYHVIRRLSIMNQTF